MCKNMKELQTVSEKIFELEQNSIRQFMQWDNGIKNQTGDKCLHRLISSNLKELLEDYEEV